MSQARQVVPGQTHLLTRRCSERRFFLKPEQKVNDILEFCLAYAAQEFGMRIHAYTFLSNHYHLVVTDTLGNLPRFMKKLNSLSARFLNRHWERKENLWSAEPYHRSTIHDTAALWDKLVYTMANAVAAGLVRKPQDWPGAHSVASKVGRVKRCKRPAGFFRDDPKSPVPDEVDLCVTKPPLLEDMPTEHYRQQLQRLLGTRVIEIRNKRREEGKRSVLGRQGVMSQEWSERPTSSAPRRRKNVSRVSCKDAGLRRRIEKTLSEWDAAYSSAWKAWKSGDRQAVFPAWTYWMRIKHRAICLPGPSG